MSDEGFNKVIDNIFSNIPTNENHNIVSAYGSINVDEFKENIKRLKLIPDYNDLLKENNDLHHQLQQKKNITKEVREYIENYPTLRYSSMDNSNGNRLTGKLVPTDKILEILDKVSDE